MTSQFLCKERLWNKARNLKSTATEVKRNHLLYSLLCSAISPHQLFFYNTRIGKYGIQLWLVVSILIQSNRFFFSRTAQLQLLWLQWLLAFIGCPSVVWISSVTLSSLSRIRENRVRTQTDTQAARIGTAPPSAVKCQRFTAVSSSLFPSHPRRPKISDIVSSSLNRLPRTHTVWLLGRGD